MQPNRRKSGALGSSTIRVQMKAPWTDPSLRELLALAALAAFGCGLAFAQLISYSPLSFVPPA
jgi:hypothetical protein